MFLSVASLYFSGSFSGSFGCFLAIRFLSLPHSEDSRVQWKDMHLASNYCDLRQSFSPFWTSASTSVKWAQSSWCAVRAQCTFILYNAEGWKVSTFSLSYMVIRHRIMNVWSRANFKDYVIQPFHFIKEKTKGLQGPAQSYKAGVWIWVIWLPRYVPFLVPSKLVKYSRVACPLARAVLVPSSPSCPTSSSLNAWPSWSLPTGASTADCRQTGQ